MSEVTLVGRCKGEGCDWWVTYDLDDTEGYLAAMVARNEHIASCQAYITSRDGAAAWVRMANEGGFHVRLQEYEKHRAFDPFVATRLNVGVLEDLLDEALDTIAKMATEALR